MNTGGQTFVLVTPFELCSMIKEAVRTEISVLRPSREIKDVLDEKQAAAYIGQKAGTLRQWRSISKGPAYHKKGRRVFYKKCDLDAWLASGRTFTGETPDAPHL